MSSNTVPLAIRPQRPEVRRLGWRSEPYRAELEFQEQSISEFFEPGPYNAHMEIFVRDPLSLQDLLRWGGVPLTPQNVEPGRGGLEVGPERFSKDAVRKYNWPCCRICHLVDRPAFGSPRWAGVVWICAVLPIELRNFDIRRLKSASTTSLQAWDPKGNLIYRTVKSRPDDSLSGSRPEDVQMNGMAKESTVNDEQQE
ncbi:hypothetical protein CDD83_9547 [Cordyceps sp. RAO-2017]|nr:hypothetical protein CDD83_9547 [Cordyceps sp. RAO-2017]